MKKTYTILLSFLFVAGLFSAQAFAAAPTQVTDASPYSNAIDGPLVIDNTSGKGGAFNYIPSPKVAISVTTFEASYQIRAANSLTDTNNGIQYCVQYNMPGYYQTTKSTIAGEGPTDADDTDPPAPPSGWDYIGSSSN
jgi:hypothetical protein